MNFNILNILLGLSVIVCLAGILLRLSLWFSQGIQPSTSTLSAGGRISAAVQGVLRVLFSSRVFLVIKSLFVDLLFQKRIFDKSYLRWTAHTLIFVGFILLFLMHALGSTVSESLFNDYQPTLNPFLFLRDLFGVMVLIGVGIAVFRRISLKSHRLKTHASDWAALVFVAVIIFSGMLLQGSKISSFTIYQNMVDEYAAFSDEEDEKALEAFWVHENGVVSPNAAKPFDPELIARGQEVNEDSCIECHVSNKNAFASFAIAKLTRPISAVVGDSTAVTVFWYLHILACLSFLAWLPFSKMFHILAAPVSLITKRVTGDELSKPANILNSQMVGLSACTHCGTCSIECSSGMFYETFQNDFILPSEKVQYLKKFAANKEHDPAIIKRMQQGLYVCTSCDRCTTVCPSGINLKELFISSRYSLLDNGSPETTMLSHFSFPLALAQNFVDDHVKALKKVTDLFKKSFQHLTDIVSPVTLAQTKGVGNNSYKGCYSCQRCTNICPVVRSYENPTEALGMLPHQIMFSLGIGNVDLAMGSQMIWSCSTCYLCQEHCPNQVELTDIFYNLKNSALQKIEAGVSS
ncbi:MAG: 4Fe-4S dicluster domain-containing protein [Desulforhopalus sp.]